jgi:HlyD family secretion protein
MIWRLVWLISALAVTCAGGYTLWQVRQGQMAGSLPTAPVRSGEFLVIVRSRGELKARRSIQIFAPKNVPDLRINWLATSGGAVKEGEVVVKFDPSSARQQLQEREANLKQAQATLDTAIAQSAILSEQDRINTAKAQYEVERAKLEVSKQEIVSRIQGEESKIDLGVAEQKAKVTEAQTRTHQVTDRTRISALERARDQAVREVEIMKKRLEQMEVRSPLSGVIVYLPNYSQGWVNAKPFKVGDRAWSGAALAEIPDLSTLEMEGKLEEIDRGKVALGNDVRIHVDALPEVNATGKLRQISPLTEESFEFPPTRSFRGYVEIIKADSRMRPSMNSSVDIVVNRIPNATSIPSKAVFTRNSKPIVYLAKDGRYTVAEVEILARNPDEVAVKGIPAGGSVALVEPAETGRKQQP